MSVPSAGVLYPSDLTNIQARAMEMWANPGRDADYQIESVAAQMLLGMQTAQFEELKNPTKDREITAYWLDDCDEDLDDCGDACSIDGVMASTSSQDYALTTCKTIGFKVPEFRLRTNVFGVEDFVARQLAKKVKALDEFWAQQVVLAMEANKGDNVYTDMYTVSAGDTTIPASAFTPELMGYINLVKTKNKLGNATLFSGGSMYLQSWRAMMNNANADGKGAANMMNSQDIVFDLFNPAAVSLGSNMYLITPNALALVTKAYYTAYSAANPADYTGEGINQKRYAIASPTLQGVSYDVHYGIKCEGSEVYHVWQLHTKGDVLANPAGCTQERTGILKLACG